MSVKKKFFHAPFKTSCLDILADLQPMALSEVGPTKKLLLIKNKKGSWDAFEQDLAVHPQGLAVRKVYDWQNGAVPGEPLSDIAPDTLVFVVPGLTSANILATVEDARNYELNDEEALLRIRTYLDALDVEYRVAVAPFTMDVMFVIDDDRAEFEALSTKCVSMLTSPVQVQEILAWLEAKYKAYKESKKQIVA